jgi:hypothetical protein
VNAVHVPPLRRAEGIMARSTVLLIVLGVLFAVAIAAAAAISALRGGEEALPDGTPGRTVQLYLKAVEDHDAIEAFSYLSPELALRCATFPKDVITNRGDASIRATLEETRVEGNTASVRVELSENFNSSPFGQDGFDQTLLFELVQVGGEWKFSSSPWPLYCAAKLP